MREEMDVKEAYLAIGCVGPDYGHDDRYAVELLVEILGRGVNPMLNSALRARRDLVQTVSMSYVPLKYGGIVMAIFTLDPKDVRMARSEALGFLKRARELNFSASDYSGEERTFAYDFLKAAGNQIRFSARRGAESGLMLAGAVARHIILGGGDGNGKDFMKEIDRVSSSDLREAAAEYFSKGDSVVVAIVPGKTGLSRPSRAAAGVRHVAEGSPPFWCPSSSSGASFPAKPLGHSANPPSGTPPTPG